MAISWKEAEKILARFFGAERTPLSGQNSKHTRSDTLHPVLFIECKYQGRESAIYKLYQETKKRAKKERCKSTHTLVKIPVVGIRTKNKPGFLLIISTEEFPHVVEEYLKHMRSEG